VQSAISKQMSPLTTSTGGACKLYFNLCYWFTLLIQR